MPQSRREKRIDIRNRPVFGRSDERVVALARTYIEKLNLPVDDLRVTTDRAEYSHWLGRRISSSYGGAYCYLHREGIHAILINLDRIRTDSPRALEVVVAEELIHMRDHLDGDHRRHAKHGYDRIARRVSALTGASGVEIRSALRPVERRPYRYIYECPNCGMRVPRKRRGTWSCARCSSRFDPRYVLRIVEEIGSASTTSNVQ